MKSEKETRKRDRERLLVKVLGMVSAFVFMLLAGGVYTQAANTIPVTYVTYDSGSTTEGTLYFDTHTNQTFDCTIDNTGKRIILHQYIGTEADADVTVPGIASVDGTNYSVYIQKLKTTIGSGDEKAVFCNSITIKKLRFIAKDGKKVGIMPPSDVSSYSSYESYYSVQYLFAGDLDPGNSYTGANYATLNKLEEVYIEGLDLSEMTSLNNMFFNGRQLKTISFGDIDTSKVTSMYQMFFKCSAIESIDVSKFNTSNVTNMRGMFLGCSMLTTLDVSGFDTSKVQSMSDMFSGCTKLENIDLSKFDTSNVTSMDGMFYGCKALTSLDVSSFDTSKVVWMSDMFRDCSAITKLNVGHFNTEKLRYWDNMFTGMKNLRGLYTPKFSNSPYSNGGGYDYSYSKLYNTMYDLWLERDEDVKPENYEPVVDITAATPRTYLSTDYNETPPEPNLWEASAGTSIAHFYVDNAYQTSLTDAYIELYANGGVVKQADGTKKSFKTREFYCDIHASYYYTTNAKGKVSEKMGKVICGITSTSSYPAIKNNKIVDKNAAKYATAKIKNGKVTVTTKKLSGKVYLWVIDTGNRGRSSYCGTCAKCPINIKAAPSGINIYDIPRTDPSFNFAKTKKVKTVEINVGDTSTLYPYPYYKDGKNVVFAKDVTFTVANASKLKYFSVVTGDALQVKALDLKTSGKKVTETITLICDQNGKKVSFKASAVNHVTSLGISLTDSSSMNYGNNGINISMSDSKKVTKKFNITGYCYGSSLYTTDTPSIHALGSKSDSAWDINAKGKVIVNTKPSGDQKLITAKISKKGEVTLTITPKKTTKEIEAYFLIYYNNTGGNMIVPVKVTIS